MVGFHICTPGLRKAALITFVKSHIPSTSELVRRARIARLPEACTCCGVSLRDVCCRYEHIPTKGLGLHFPKGTKPPQVMQLVRGGENCFKMKEGVCRIVHRHLVRSFRTAGIVCEPMIV